MTTQQRPPIGGASFQRRQEAAIGHRAALDAACRAGLAATGPEDEAALDVPQDPDAPWQCVTVEEVLVMERARLEACRDALLDVFDSSP